MRYRLELSETAQKQIAKLNDPVKNQILQKIEVLSSNPRPQNCLKIKGETDLYRIRSGDYRIIYEIKDQILVVLVIRIGHRREVYRNL